MGDKVTDAIIGFGDAFLIPILVRKIAGIEGTFDSNSTSYGGGGLLAFAFGFYRMAYATAAKGYSVFAASGAEASALRGSMRWVGAPSRNLAQYKTDAALRAAAGQSNPFVNTGGAVMMVGGAYVAGACE